MERLTYNEWTVSGEVIYIKELDASNEFGCSVKLRGTARRKGANSSQVMEFGCLMERDTYAEALAKGFDKFKYVTLGGHVETWVKQREKEDRPRTRFVCDDILEVC